MTINGWLLCSANRALPVWLLTGEPQHARQTRNLGGILNIEENDLQIENAIHDVEIPEHLGELEDPLRAVQIADDGLHVDLIAIHAEAGRRAPKCASRIHGEAARELV